MAKEKKPLTPEQAEIKAMKKTRRSERTTKFFAVLLALILTLSVVFSGKSIAESKVETANGNNTNEPGQITDDPDADADLWGDSNTDTTPGDTTPSGDGSDVQAPSTDDGNATQTPSGGDSTQTPSGSGSQTPAQPTSVSKADAVKALNEATKKAVNAGYDWSRKCYYTQPLDVSGKDALNGVIARVDENASIDSVVGGFLDITGNDAKTATKAKGAGMPDEMKKDKFLLKATTLTEGDIKQYQVSGNTYKFQINSCSNPQKDGSNALSRATNDFITHQEVVDGVASALGSFSSLLSVKSSDVQYSSIVITAVIDNGQLTSFNLTYVMTVKALELRAAVVPITGTGAGKVEETYNNFKY